MINKFKYKQGVNLAKLSDILQELDNFVPKASKHAVVEARANHVIASAVNLIKTIKENYNEQDALDLTKRLVKSILSEDPKKFQRKIKVLKETSNVK